MKKHLVLILVLSIGLPVTAQPQRFYVKPQLWLAENPSSSQSYFSQMYKFASEDSQVRGGGKTGKPLGLYAGGFNQPYKSGYAKLDPKVQAEFAAALNSFILNSGGGYAVYQSAPRASEPVVTYTPLDKKLQQLDPTARAFVPYKKQEQFAKSWWERQNPEFSKMGFVWKDWWVNDSILDANLLISRETIRVNGATAATYNSAVFAKLMQKE